VSDVKNEGQEGDYSSNLEAMSCQSESEGSSDGAGEGEAGKGGAGEELDGSEGIRNLVSGGFVRLYVVVRMGRWRRMSFRVRDTKELMLTRLHH